MAKGKTKRRNPIVEVAPPSTRTEDYRTPTPPAPAPVLYESSFRRRPPNPNVALIDVPTPEQQNTPGELQAMSKNAPPPDDKCKKKPDDNRSKGGGSRRYVPWC